MPETETMQTEGHAESTSTGSIFADILCAINGKEGAFSAVEHAADLAGTHGRLTFLAVTSYRSAGGYRGPAIGPAQAAEILDRADAIARGAGVPFANEVDPRSPPAQVILNWSERYDLLAIGAPKRSWPAGLLSVGVADKALGGFSTALLVGRPLADGRRFGDRIVVASDGSEASNALVGMVGELARSRNSSVTLVHALGRESPIKRNRPPEQERTLKQQQQTLARTTPSGKSELVLKHGRAAEVVVSTANAHDASLVVMGSRRLDGLRAMGSVSRRVAHQARCSVLLVPPETLTC